MSRTTFILLSTHTHANCGLHLRAGKDWQTKAHSEIPVLICISWIFLPLEKLCITGQAVCCFHQTLHMCCNKAQPHTRHIPCCLMIIQTTPVEASQSGQLLLQTRTSLVSRAQFTKKEQTNLEVAYNAVLLRALQSTG